jgi:hypothetical protein
VGSRGRCWIQGEVVGVGVVEVWGCRRMMRVIRRQVEIDRRGCVWRRVQKPHNYSKGVRLKDCGCGLMMEEEEGKGKGGCGAERRCLEQVKKCRVVQCAMLGICRSKQGGGKASFVSNGSKIQSTAHPLYMHRATSLLSICLCLCLCRCLYLLVLHTAPSVRMLIFVPLNSQ